MQPAVRLGTYIAGTCMYLLKGNRNCLHLGTEILVDWIALTRTQHIWSFLGKEVAWRHYRELL